MKINLRVKKLRQKLGLDFSSFVDTLFEDIPLELRKQYNENFLKAVEAGKKPVDILLVQQILKKYRVNPYWLINGDEQMTVEDNNQQGKIVITQDGQDANRQNIHIVDDKEMVAKLLAEKDAHIERAYTEIERLKQTIILISDLKQQQQPTIQSKVASSSFPSQHVAVILSILMMMIVIIFVNKSPNQYTSEEKPVPIHASYPKNFGYERLIEQLSYRDMEKNSIVYHEHHQGMEVFHIRNSSADRLEFQVEDYKNEVHFQQFVFSGNSQIKVDLSNYPSGVYYYLLEQDGQVIAINSLIKH